VPGTAQGLRQPRRGLYHAANRHRADGAFQSAEIFGPRHTARGNEPLPFSPKRPEAPSIKPHRWRNEASVTPDSSATRSVRPERRAARLISVQCLRGIAALMVVVHHVLHQSPGFLSVWPTEAWQSGVDLFFVISGFVMVYVTSQREQSPRRFLTMRAARIVPVYWFYTLLAAGLYYVVPSLFRSNEFSLSHIVLSMLFVPHGKGDLVGIPLVKQGWTLNLEVFFYVLFAIAMAISLKHRTVLAVAALAMIAAVGPFYPIGNTSPIVWSLFFYTNPIILEFAFGMLIATAFLRGKFDFLKPPLAGVLVVSGFLAIFILPPECERVLAYGLPAAAVLIGALAFEQHIPIRQRFLESVGDASYSIYLVHIFAIAVLRKFWPLSMDGLASLALFLVASIALVVVIGRLSYALIERPSLQFLRKVIARAS